MTHRDRDDWDTANGVAYLMATSDNTRCRCDYQGEACRRFADAEDLLCEWCRAHKGKDAHLKACYELESSYRRGQAGPTMKGNWQQVTPEWQQIGPETVKWLPTGWDKYINDV